MTQSRSNSGIALDLAFKGSRDYLHGTDIFQAATTAFRPAANIKFQVQRLVRVQLTAIEATGGLDRRSASAFLKFDDANGAGHTVYFIEDQARAVSRRYPYDEGAVVKSANFSSGSVNQILTKEYTFVEHVVALQKVLLSREIPLGDGRWLFTQLLLDRLPLETEVELSLTLSSSLGTRLVRSDIAFSGSRIGQISFSVAGGAKA